ncbi:3-keto-disaccharide hydrolase [Pelagicoccus mobilis]|uniref:DUF1080 domain-containing protein n=1 Tax=Pelagicoccus mobilis TaxID=415221 RepID=A0A934VT05_9BACT|nr:DUF1080 domain-containing protein [Pelagicoccus mobilis]MBK1879034.1 DUF1080 domain-containing protein [Pelagicoccus mobilis]
MHYPSIRIKLLSTLICAFLFCFQLNAEEGWVSLFDGESMDGWVQMNGTVTYAVEEGSIVGTSLRGDSPMSFLCTEKQYSDFELEFEVKLFDKELNSGVQIRSLPKETKRKGAKYGPIAGPQIEITANKNGGPTPSGYVYGQGWDGWITSKEARVPHRHFRLGEWNRYRVVAKGPKIVSYLNGVLITETMVPSDRHTTQPKGHIGLQVHSLKEAPRPFRVAWKNIRIKEL